MCRRRRSSQLKNAYKGMDGQLDFQRAIEKFNTSKADDWEMIQNNQDDLIAQIMNHFLAPFYGFGKPIDCLVTSGDLESPHIIKTHLYPCKCRN